MNKSKRLLVVVSLTLFLLVLMSLPLLVSLDGGKIRAMLGMKGPITATWPGKGDRRALNVVEILGFAGVVEIEITEEGSMNGARVRTGQKKLLAMEFSNNGQLATIGPESICILDHYGLTPLVRIDGVFSSNGKVSFIGEKKIRYQSPFGETSEWDIDPLSPGLRAVSNLDGNDPSRATIEGKEIVVRRIADQTELLRLSTGDEEAFSLSWSTDSQYIAAVTPSYIIVWSVTDGSEIFRVDGQFDPATGMLSFTPDDSHDLFYGHYPGRGNKPIYYGWDIKTGKETVDRK